MTNLFPPVLDARGLAFPFYPTGAIDATYRLDIIFTLPNLMSITDVGHFQVSIKYKSTGRSALSNDWAPEGDVLYLSKDDNANKSRYGAEYTNMVVVNQLPMIRLSIPYRAFENRRPSNNTDYLVQVRFGASSNLWQDFEAGSNANFHAWKISETNTVPSNFGEWSNISSRYCSEPPHQEVTYDFIDLMPTVHYTYTLPADSIDSLAQVKIVWQYQYGARSTDRVVRYLDTQIFSGQRQANNSYTCSFTIPVLPIVPIFLSIEAISKYNYLCGMIPVIPNFTVDTKGIVHMPDEATMNGENLPRLFGTVQNHQLNSNEIDDGCIAKDITIISSTKIAEQPEQEPAIHKLNFYRVNLLDLRVIRIQKEVELRRNEEYTFRDFSVEMGEPYQYIITRVVADKPRFVYFFSNKDNPDSTMTGASSFSPLSITNACYGRLDRLDSVYLSDEYHQLRISGNVQISNLKRNTSDVFQTTIGSQYPFYSRPSRQNYKTFSIGGVVSINFDPTGLFLKNEATFLRDSMKQGIERSVGLTYRTPTQSKVVLWNEDFFNYDEYSRTVFRTQKGRQAKLVMPELGKSNLASPWGAETIQYDSSLTESPILDNSTYQRTYPRTIGDGFLVRDLDRQISMNPDSISIFAERKFREAVMEWLSDGKPKLFRSETEGNMIVILSGIQFSPLNATGRMVYGFSGSATEIAEYNTDNLTKYKLLPLDISSTTNVRFPKYLAPGSVISGEDFFTLLRFAEDDTDEIYSETGQWLSDCFNLLKPVDQFNYTVISGLKYKATANGEIPVYIAAGEDIAGSAHYNLKYNGIPLPMYFYQLRDDTSDAWKIKINELVKRITDSYCFDYHRGQIDPFAYRDSIEESLILQYNEQYDIPDCEVDLSITPINFYSALRNRRASCYYEWDIVSTATPNANSVTQSLGFRFDGAVLHGAPSQSWYDSILNKQSTGFLIIRCSEYSTLPPEGSEEPNTQTPLRVGYMIIQRGIVYPRLQISTDPQAIIPSDMDLYRYYTTGVYPMQDQAITPIDVFVGGGKPFTTPWLSQ